MFEGFKLSEEKFFFNTERIICLKNLENLIYLLFGHLTNSELYITTIITINELQHLEMYL